MYVAQWNSSLMRGAQRAEAEGRLPSYAFGVFVDSASLGLYTLGSSLYQAIKTGDWDQFGESAGAFGTGVGTAYVGGRIIGAVGGLRVPPRAGTLPEGATVLRVDPAGNWLVYRNVQGQQIMRFNASEAVTAQPPLNATNNTPATEAALSSEGRVFVIEGRHRAVAAGNEGASIAPSQGGVPSAPGWLDYSYNPTPQTTAGMPVRGMTNPSARQPSPPPAGDQRPAGMQTPQ